VWVRVLPRVQNDRINMNRTSKEELEKLILIDKLSYAEIARTFGVSDVTIRTWAIKLGINIPSRKKILENKICLNCNNEFKPSGTTNKYCSQQCSNEHKIILNYEKYKLDNSILYGQSNMSNYKKHFLKEQDYKCTICGNPNTWNDKELVFVLDHIDGNADNNERSNLRCICPNCDSQLDTFKSKNKNSARAKYRQTLKVEECV